MQRLRADRERGATAIIFALLLTVLVGFIGLAVDVGASYAKKQELQNGADAAALAVAQQCATDSVSQDCPSDQALADSYTAGNVRNETDTVTADVTYPEPNQVRVAARGDQQHWFVPVLDDEFDSTTVAASATVGWGNPVSGTAVLPIAFSVCELDAQLEPVLDQQQTIVLPKKSDTGCTGPNGFFVPGGFAWLTTNGDQPCSTTSAIDGWVSSDPGKSVPQSCDAAYFQSLVGQVVLLPMFEEYQDQGASGEYLIHGYVAFRLDGYFFANKYQHNPGCKQPEQCVTGSFVEYVDLDDAFEYGSAPDLADVPHFSLSVWPPTCGGQELGACGV